MKWKKVLSVFCMAAMAVSMLVGCGNGGGEGGAPGNGGGGGVVGGGKEATGTH